jgi:hypothetical protein
MAVVIGTGQFRGQQERGTWAEYLIKAEFEAGPAEIRIVLKRVSDSWQIREFHVNSPAFSRPTFQRSSGKVPLGT